MEGGKDMEELTITEVSRDFGISTRMLRYYEQTGLLRSFRKEDYAYRMYDGEALSRLRQILILRRLRIPVKQIRQILQKPDAVVAIDVFRQNIEELDEEITALSTIRDILARFVDELRKTAGLQLPQLILQDDTITASIDSLSLTSINFKEDKTMDQLKKAEESLSRLRDVRIVYLPPAAVAAAHYVGDDPEDRAGRMLEDFIRESGLIGLKPDVRQYGFNHPNPVDETDFHGYEFWVTIPEDLEVPAPLEKKYFKGGMYAAHMITMGNFNEWDWLYQWLMANGKYEFAGDMADQEHMMGCLEEHLNFMGHYTGLDSIAPEEMQLDLLIPVKMRTKAAE
jgi:DNA-binding transcriptional MerR regulator/DNA gyrase inhibitor GyrI